MALDLMDFDGKEKIVKKIGENKGLADKLQQMKQTMDKMAITIEKLDPSINLTGRSKENGRSPNQPNR
jgi:hypothetical protein